MNFNGLKIAAMTALCGLAGLQPASADFPEKNITIVTPFNAGGGSDILARTLGPKMSKVLGREIIVENRPGAAGTIGTDYVARAKPDGYTLLVVTSISHVTAARSTPGARYEPYKSFTGVGGIGEVALLLIGRPDFADDYGALLAKLKESPGKLAFSSAGIGHSTHLMMERFKALAGVDIKHVPYNGGGPAVNAVVSGTVALQFENVTAAELLRAGKMRAFAATGSSRTEFFPNVPTFAELGQKGFEDAVAYYGVIAPAGVPPEVLEKLNGALNEALKAPDVKEVLGRQLVTPKPSTAKEYTERLRIDDERYTAMIKETQAAPNN